MATADSDVAVVIDTSTKISMKPPGMYNVVLYNDDRTTVDFVIMILVAVFHKSQDEAYAITMHVHDNGKGIAGTYSQEVATQKRDDTTSIAQNNGFQLKCEVEKA